MRIYAPVLNIKKERVKNHGGIFFLFLNPFDVSMNLSYFSLMLTASIKFLPAIG